MLDDERCVGLMADFIAARPDLWHEDIGVVRELTDARAAVSRRIPTVARATPPIRRARARRRRHRFRPNGPGTARRARTPGVRALPCARRPPVTRPTPTGSGCDGWRRRWSAAIRCRCTSRSARSGAPRWPGRCSGCSGSCARRGVRRYGAAADWRGEDLVVGAGVRRDVAVAHRPDRLVPVPNMVAGRLVLAALARRAGRATPGARCRCRCPTTSWPPLRARRPPRCRVRWPSTPAGRVPPRWAVCDALGPDGRIRDDHGRRRGRSAPAGAAGRRRAGRGRGRASAGWWWPAGGTASISVTGRCWRRTGWSGRHPGR